MASPSTSSIHKRFNNDASSSTPPVLKRFKYDVFLSFRGIDTRKNFVDHLYDALQRKGIRTYKDDKRITKGKQICDELIGSIEDSNFYIIIFSKNYASSSWCLDELVKIMECQKTTDHTAYPVFYDVEPTEVRKQSGAVGEAFAKHENKENAGKWRKAMKEAADLAGWELKNTADGHEAKFIQKVIEEISLELRGISFTIDEKLVGMETQIYDVLSSVGSSDDDARMIGIIGMGGAGKTTLARAIFDQISSQFEGQSFVENVREDSKASLLGLKSLQNQILFDVFNDKGVTVSSVHQGIGMMKRMMPCKKVILVLDDVDHRDQLKALAGDMTWFKAGSVIIITTRDRQVLEFYAEKSLHDVQLLSDEDAMCLFRRNAFGKVIPNAGYEELSQKFVKYAAGLPLAIEVLGSFLCGKDELQWTDALSRLKRFPSQEILKVLEISYSDLEKDFQEIFLNVACLLKGWQTAKAIKVLESCEFNAISGLRVLQLKSLLTVDPFGCLGMHDLIEEMGMNIVRRSHPHNPNKHSRLWIDEEIKEILANDLGTKKTRYIQLMGELSPEIVMHGLRKMKELRFLHVSGGFYDASESQNWNLNELPNALPYLWGRINPFRSLPTAFQANNLIALKMPLSRSVQLWEGRESQNWNLNELPNDASESQNWNLNELPNALRYLWWHRYPFRSLPTAFQANNLVALEMPLSRIVQLWEGRERKVLNKLRFLNLSGSKLRTLDLGVAPNLEKLDLVRCVDLIELRFPHICSNLRSLKLSDSKLKYLDLRLLPNLEKLDLGRCVDLIELLFPDEILNLRSLKLNDSKFRTLDIGQTPSLETLILKDCYKLEEFHMAGQTPSLETLILKDCYKLEEFHMAGGCLNKVVYLDLSGSLGFESFKFKIEDESSWSEDDATCSADESLEGGPSAELYLIADSRLQIKCYYKEDRPLLSRNLQKLISVGLCACTNLDTFSRSICGLQHLRKLTLQGSILEAPKDLDQLEFLQHLDFSYTKIKHLPDSICLLKHLKSIKLHKCSLLEKLPEDLGRLECLEYLYLRGCELLREVPDSICNIKCLKIIDLRDCFRVEKLPEEIGRFQCLEYLFLQNTGISHLPQSILLLKGLWIYGSRGLLQSSGFSSEIWCLSLDRDLYCVTRNSPFSTPRPLKSKYHDEEDNWSMASSAATSRTVKSRVTVGVAPSFKSAQRAAQYQELYTKLEQNHQALKAEKMEYEEDEEEAIQQMRKSMVVKANPTPSFYRQGPPPKVELKKLPLTRTKSPKLTRRKSYCNTTHPTVDVKALYTSVRHHSLGTYKPVNTTSSLVKSTQGRTINGINRPKDKDRPTKPVSEPPKASPRKLAKETNSDITVQS